MRSPSRTTNQRLLSSSARIFHHSSNGIETKPHSSANASADRVVELLGFLLAKGVHGKPVGELGCGRLRVELDRHLVVAPRLAIAAGLHERGRTRVGSQRVLVEESWRRAPVRAALARRASHDPSPAPLRARTHPAPPERNAVVHLHPAAARPPVRPPRAATSPRRGSCGSTTRGRRTRRSSPVKPERPLVLREQLGDERRVLAAHRSARDAVRERAHRAPPRGTRASATRASAL